MIEGIYADIKSYETERSLLSYCYEFGRPTDLVFGPWKSKVTIEFEGYLPDWLAETAKNNGKVRIIP
jgi:hypothetical protein